MAGKNRERQQQAKQLKRDAQASHMVADAERKYNSHFNLDWFQPTELQKEIQMSYWSNDLTVVQGSSGTGKSTTVIHAALQDIKDRRYRQLVFVKTPAELGDDKIGFLSGSADEKLERHFQSMRTIFHSFMTVEKLKMEEAHKVIRFDIPNFIAGETLDNTIFIIDEGQLISDNTMKLLVERAGINTKVVILGDKAQTYAKDYRTDGLSRFIDMITEVDEDGVRHSVEPTMGYVELKAGDNMRSALSKRVVELYEGRK